MILENFEINGADWSGEIDLETVVISLSGQFHKCDSGIEASIDDTKGLSWDEVVDALEKAYEDRFC